MLKCPPTEQRALSVDPAAESIAVVLGPLSRDKRLALALDERLQARIGLLPGRLARVSRPSRKSFEASTTLRV